MRQDAETGQLVAVETRCASGVAMGAVCVIGHTPAPPPPPPRGSEWLEYSIEVPAREYVFALSADGIAYVAAGCVLARAPP